MQHLEKMSGLKRFGSSQVWYIESHENGRDYQHSEFVMKKAENRAPFLEGTKGENPPKDTEQQWLT